MLAALRRRRADMATISRVLAGAEQRALADGLARAGAEHVILAALDLPDGSARRVFARAGADPDGFAPAVAAQHAAALAAAGIAADDAALQERIPPAPGHPRGPMRSDPSVERLLRDAAAAVKRDGTPLTGAHLVRAAASQEHGTVPRTLRHLGIAPGDLIAAATAEISAAR